MEIKKEKKKKKEREKPLDRSYGPIISKNITCTTGFLLYIWKTSIPSLFVFFTYCPFIYIYIYKKVHMASDKSKGYLVVK
jgi:hypothetical protein